MSKAEEVECDEPMVSRSLATIGYMKNHNMLLEQRNRELARVHEVWDSMLEDLNRSETQRVERETKPELTTGQRVVLKSGRVGVIANTKVSVAVDCDDYYHPESYSPIDVDEQEGDPHRYMPVIGEWEYQVRLDPTPKQAQKRRKGWIGWVDISEIEVVDENR